MLLHRSADWHLGGSGSLETGSQERLSLSTSAMYNIIGGDQKEYGPITADDLRRWIAEGRLSGQSLVRAEGGGEWRMLSAFPEFTEALQAQAGQSPSAGPISPPPITSAWSAEVLARQPEVQIGHCLWPSRGLLDAHFGGVFGA